MSKTETERRLAGLGLAVPEILTPAQGIDLKKWAVIACDQFTQDRRYWEAVMAEAGGAPSCANLILPEVWLDDNRAGRIETIGRSMTAYLNGKVFAPPRRCCVYIERSTPRHPRRRGLVIAVDLEQYDWAPGAKPLIRATEGTIRERLPPRMEIRRGAPLETPHILILIDDEDDAIIPALGEAAKKQPPLYDSPLMMDSGAVKGWALEHEDDFAALAAGLEKLAEKAAGRYGVRDTVPFLYAAGDGNHSLATAKAVWDEYKSAHAGEASSTPGLEEHPARWALVEIENIYDEGIAFEPIHRVIFGVKAEDVLGVLTKLPDLVCKAAQDKPGIIQIETTGPSIATASLQPALDSFVKAAGASMDYIHGEEELFRLAADPGRPAVGLLLPPIQKSGLFRTVAQTGPLPRKSFSMGTAEEKRFYLECRKLF